MPNRMPMLSDLSLEELETGVAPKIETELDEHGFGPALSMDAVTGKSDTPLGDAFDADEQRKMFKMHGTQKADIEIEPEPSGPAPGQSRAGYAWTKFGDMLKRVEPTESDTPTTPILPVLGSPAVSPNRPQPVTDAGEAPIPSISESKIWPALKRLGNKLTNPLFGNLPPDAAGKTAELLNPFTAYETYKNIDKKAQVEKALEWAASDERFKEIRDKYSRDPMPEEMANKFDVYLNDRLDDIADNLIKLGGQAEGAASLIVGAPGFMAGTAAGVSDALWQLVTNAGKEKGLDPKQIFEAGSHGYQFATYVMEKLMLHPGSEAGQHTVEDLMYPFTEFEKGIEYTGWYFGWSKEATDTAKLAFFVTLAGHGAFKGIAKPGAKTIKRTISNIKDSLGKRPMTQEEIDFYGQHHKDATKTDAIDKFRAMQEAANEDAAIVLRGIREKTGLEDLEAFQDGTFGGSFTEFYSREARNKGKKRRRKAAPSAEEVSDAQVAAEAAEAAEMIPEGVVPAAATTPTSEPTKTTRIRRKAKKVEETMAEPTQQVDHVLGNGEMLNEVARRLEDKGKHDEAATYRQQVAEAIARIPDRAEREVDLARQERLAKLREIHADWELKRARAMEELDKEVGLGSPEHVKFEQNFYTEHGRFPTEKEFAASLKKTTKVEPVEGIDARVQDNPLFDPLEATLEKSKMYNDPDVARRVTADPLVASQKLVNDINRYTHGDRSVNIDEVIGVLRKMEENSDKLKGYFTTQAEREAFTARVSDAIEYGMLAKNPESVPVRSIKDLDQGGITLAMGFDPTILSELKPDFTRMLENAKKLTGKMSPDKLRSGLEKFGTKQELNVLGVYDILDRAKKEGKELSKEDILAQLEPIKLKMSFSNYLEDMVREFPDNIGYENHLYRWDIPEFYAGGHFGDYPNTLFHARVSRNRKGGYFLEELQSDYWQKGGAEKIQAEPPFDQFIEPSFIPFKDSWGKNAIGLEIFNAISEGAKEFNVSTAETVARAEGLISANDTFTSAKARAERDAALGNERGKYVSKTLNALISTYDSGVPKWIKQFFSRYGEQVKVERVEGIGKSSVLSEHEHKYWSGALHELINPTYFDSMSTLTRMIDRANTLRSWNTYSSVRDNFIAIEKVAKRAADEFERGDMQQFEITVAALTSSSGAIGSMLGTRSNSYWSVKIPTSFAERVKAKAEVPTIKLNALPDPFELVKSLSGDAKQFIAWTENLRHEKRISKNTRIQQLKTKTAHDFVDVKYFARKMLDLLPDQAGHDAHRALILTNGAQTMAGIHIKRAKKAAYGGLGTVKKRVLDSMIFARRIIAIDNARAEEALKTGKLRKVDHPKLTEAQAKALGFDKAVELDGTVAKKYLDQLQATLDPADFAELVKRSEIYFDTMRDALKVLKDRQLISTKLYNKLLRFDYEKRQDIMAKLDPETTHLIGKEPVTVKESGVKSLKKGTNEDLLEIDSEMLMADVIRATYGRAFRNDANLALRKIGETHPDNGIVKIPKDAKDTPPRGWSRAELFVEGKKEKLFLENDFARSWLINNNEISFEIARRNQLLSGSAILKPMATGINPEFAFANIMRDLGHIWLTSQVKVGDKWVSTYSPHLPMAIPMMMKDLAMVTHDAFTRKGRWLDAVEDGMGMQFLTHEGRIFKDQPGTKRPLEALDTVQEFVGYLNETSEILGRLMVRERAMRLRAKQKGISFERFQELNEATRPTYKDGKIVENPRMKELMPEELALVADIRKEGSFTARDYMDFSVHGSKGEYIDTLIPYFNASMQGTRGLFRSAKRNPAEFAQKLAHLTGAVATLYMINRLNNEDALKHISEQARINNFIIATNIKITDSSGVERYVYYKIPKDPSQKYFSYMIEQFMGKFLFDEEVDFPSVVESVGSLFPVSPENALGLTPTGNALLAAYNIDAWRTMLGKDNKQIWTGGQLPRGEQHKAVIEGRGSKDTPAWARHLGDALDIKPVIVQQMMGSYITHQGNLWTWLGGQAYDQMFGPAADEIKQQAFADAVSQYEKQGKLPILRRFVGLTASETETAIKIGEEITQKYTLENVMLENKLNILNEDYMLGIKDLSDYVALRIEHPEFKEKIKSEMEAAKTIMNPDFVSPQHRSFWFHMRKPARNEERAERYYARYMSANTAEEQMQLEFERIFLGYNTPDFRKEYFRIRAEGE